MKEGLLMLDFEQQKNQPAHTSGFATHGAGAAWGSKAWDGEWEK